MKRVLLVLSLLGTPAFAKTFNAFFDCFNALDGHVEVLGIENTSVNLKKPHEKRDLYFVYSPAEPPSVYVYGSDDAWSFPLPAKKSADVAIGEQRLANVKWADGAEPVFATFLVEERSRKAPSVIQILRTEDDPRSEPHTFQPGKPPVRHLGVDSKTAVSAFAEELIKKIKAVPGSFRQQKELFGINPTNRRDENGKPAPSLIDEYTGVLDKCGQIAKTFPEAHLPGFQKALVDVRAAIAERPKAPPKAAADEGKRHRQGPGEHSDDGATPASGATHGPGGDDDDDDGPVKRPEADQ